MKLTVTTTVLLISTVVAIDLDVSSKESICSAASTIAKGVMDYYEGTRYGGVVGMFQQPYYWWEAGEAFGSLLDNWYYCQNSQYQAVISDAIIAQCNAPAYDFMPLNQTVTEANDDQVVWGIVVMAAAEHNFPLPDGTGASWAEMAENVADSMFARWDPDNCNGGLRWQIFPNMSGWDYKNAISNGGLFHLASRLYRYTDDTKYLDMATKVYTWMVDINMLDTRQSPWALNDGANIGDDNCGEMVNHYYSYSYGLMLSGAAYLFNATENEEWYSATYSLLIASADLFFYESVMREYQCYVTGLCNNDQRSFRSLFSRSLGLTTVMVPQTAFPINWLLSASARGAAASCSGGSDGVTCGFDWSKGSWDGWYGLGEQISAMECIQNLLASSASAPLTQQG
ncbi:glycoside hydrolase family 76 protein [Babjeviella inositovora NRRL Y-12698]|uniref:mannan endo-1,6-alpha-mannosidase n=1 Tax=Babjeviella inositovora NRRL Y-12698 TaxID=984486 RepID=A0A1E3QKN6_9ASCO|nr:glycoside hydrolase family 76 protein [Babjeviella inositovora NRRL Y-12698]ODQ78245.1 glycoside hydrolase family 76 protein [Babjeviella inositovora NRRL Y-12698]